jgi:sugar O-acyltransferase (sialic acid O-acetyltransferase NeuD family)
MLIVGAKGFAKEVLDVVSQSYKEEDIVFYDDYYEHSKDLFNKFPILQSPEAVKNYFNTHSNEFTLGIGNPALRKKLYDKFVDLNGIFTSTISNHAILGDYNVNIGSGCNIMHGAILSNDIAIGIGCIIYFNSLITHDAVLGNFVEISPSANILGRCQIGDFSQIGSNATILPDIKIGKNAIVAAGSVVTKDVSNNTMVAGIPATFKKQLEPLTY